MQTPAKTMADILVAAGLGTFGGSTGWRVGVGPVTDDPDQQVVVADAPGQTPDPKWLLDYPYAQVMVRGTEDGYVAASQKMQDAYDALLGYPPSNVAGVGRIDGITAISTPSFIGLDKLNRPCFVLNMRMIFEPAVSALTHRLPL